jgi:hypothetical protein
MEVLVVARATDVTAELDKDRGVQLQAGNGSGGAMKHKGHELPTDGLAAPAFCQALHATLRALIDDLGVEAFNVGILNVPLGGVNTHDLLVARVVSRGRMSQPASDFGCLEVSFRSGLLLCIASSKECLYCLHCKYANGKSPHATCSANLSEPAAGMVRRCWAVRPSAIQTLTGSLLQWKQGCVHVERWHSCHLRTWTRSRCDY